VLLKVAGQDATKQFDQFHNDAILQKWGPKLYKGDIGSAAPVKAIVSTADMPLVGVEEGEAFGDGIPFGDP
jgi:cytochrome b involved in lipid metabolism